MNTLRTHVGYLIVIAVAVVLSYFVFTSWRAEHDARLTAQIQEKADEATIKTLRQEQADRDALAARTIADLQKRRESIKTPQQVVSALPEVTNLSQFPINARVIPGNDVDVQVAAKPIYDALNQCRQDQVALGACLEGRKTDAAIVAEKDDEIAALKKKPGFWNRMYGKLKDGGVAVVVWEFAKIVVTRKP